VKMQDLSGRRVKISASTLTVKDENDKTRGLVRGVRSYKTWSAREQFDNRVLLGVSGLWAGANSRLIDLDRVILDGSKMYFLHDLRREENYHKYWEHMPGCDAEREHHAQYMEILKKCEAAGVSVISCYVI